MPDLDYKKLSRELGYEWIEDGDQVWFVPSIYDRDGYRIVPLSGNRHQMQPRAEAIARFEQLAARFRRD